jgi:hypothetical protein
MSVENTVPPMRSVKILKKIKPSVKSEDHRITISQTIFFKCHKKTMQCSRGGAKKSISFI